MLKVRHTLLKTTQQTMSMHMYALCLPVCYSYRIILLCAVAKGLYTKELTAQIAGQLSVHVNL